MPRFLSHQSNPPQGQRHHLVILNAYSHNQAKWADFVEITGQYLSVSKQCKTVDVIVPVGTVTAPLSKGALKVHEVGGSLSNPLFFAISSLRKLSEIHRQDAIDVLWAQDPLLCGLVAWITSLRHGTPWVAEVCNDFFDLHTLKVSFVDRWVKAAVAQWVARRATRVRAVSMAIRDHLLRRGVPETKISVLCCPTDIGRFNTPLDSNAHKKSEARKVQEKILLMFVGALIYRKGVDLLIDAVAELRHWSPAIEVRIVGDGPLRAFLESRTAFLNLRDVVRFCGHVPHTKVPELLATADIVVLPSRNEGLPRCLVEAFASGKPVVATRISGNLEVVQDNRSGFLVEPTVRGIHDGLARMLSLTREAREEMGRIGRERVSVQFDLQVVVDRMVRELIDLPASRGEKGSSLPNAPSP